MPQADTKRPAGGQSHGGGGCDLLVVGGGIMGLWAAWFAARAGLTVTLLDSAAFGHGASHGLLGALMPHMPDKWNQKKQFQFDALTELEDLAGLLEGETGLSTGYRRTGRLIPLPKPHLRVIAERHSADALQSWGTYRWTVIDAPPQPGFPAADLCGAGLVHDTLAARVSPRRLTAALVAALDGMERVRLLPHIGVQSIDARHLRVTLDNGITLAAGDILLANGHAGFAMIETLCGGLIRRPLGQAVKGQAALLAAPLPPELPVLYVDGLYVIVHDAGQVAIGSTSENSFADPVATDHQLDDLILRARELVPALRDAPVRERWSGLRPKAIGRDPIAGALPHLPHVHVLNGGFKVSFGIAHRLAEALIGTISGQGRAIALPESFAPAQHLALASRE